MVKGRIKLGSKTTGHQAFLQAQGYETVVEGDHLIVNVSEFVDQVDLSGDNRIDVLKALVAEKKAASYSTKFLFSDGKVLFGVPACTRLGKASALIMKPVKAGAKKASASTEFDSL